MKTVQTKLLFCLASLATCALHAQSLEAEIKTNSIVKRMNMIRTKLAAVSPNEVIPAELSPDQAERRLASIPEINNDLYNSMRKMNFVLSLRQLAFLRLDQNSANALAAYQASVNSTETPKEDRRRILEMFTEKDGKRSADRLLQLAKSMDEQESIAMDPNASEHDRDGAVDSYSELRREALVLTNQFSSHVSTLNQVGLLNFVRDNRPDRESQSAEAQVPDSWHFY